MTTSDQGHSGATSRLSFVQRRYKEESPASAGLSGDGRYWARTSDPQLVELVLSQLS